MITSLNNHRLIYLLIACFTLFSTSAYADVDSSGILDDVLNAYAAQAAGWAAIVTNSAQWLFWLLVSISMIFTFGYMALQKADIGEFFAEFIRFIIFVGFFQWLLINGPNFSTDIINSLRQIGGNASGLGAGLTPSGIVDIGFDIIGRIFDVSTIWSPIDSAAGLILGLIILVVLAVVGINMLLLLISAWFLSFAGIFFLGFGGSKWTSDMAINYYKTVLGLAAELMAMVLLVGIGQNIIVQYQNDLSGEIQLVELCVILIVAITLLLLTNKIPPLLSGVITGSSIGGHARGSMGMGGAIGGAAALATAGAAMASGVASVAASAAGGGSAIAAAFKEAQATIQSGGDSLATSLSGVNSGSQDFNSANQSSDFAISMGDGATPSDISTATSNSVSAASESSGIDTGNLSEQQSSESSSAIPNDSVDSGNLEGGSSSSNQATSNEANTEGANSSDTSSSSSESGGVGQSLKKAGAIAGLTLQNLAKGAAAHTANAVGEKMDKVKESIADTAGGKIASEIKNPGQAKQQREDAKLVAAAEQEGAAQELAQKAAEIRGTNIKESTSDDEVSNFVNKSDEKE